MVYIVNQILKLFRQPELVNGALIHGLEARVNVIEDKLSDLDARTSEEADNALNERELDRFIMSGIYFVNLYIVSILSICGRCVLLQLTFIQ